jgi:hypothetical protein
MTLHSEYTPSKLPSVEIKNPKNEITKQDDDLLQRSE